MASAFKRSSRTACCSQAGRGSHAKPHGLIGVSSQQRLGTRITENRGAKWRKVCNGLCRSLHPSQRAKALQAVAAALREGHPMTNRCQKPSRAARYRGRLRNRGSACRQNPPRRSRLRFERLEQRCLLTVVSPVSHSHVADPAEDISIIWRRPLIRPR